VLAVEVHQRTANSTDLSFAARLTATLIEPADSLDGDADGIADLWEEVHFGATEACLPGADADGDGWSNGAEFVAGTLPGDPGSFFRVELRGGNALSWTPAPGRSYAVFWTDDLRNPFVPLAVGLTGGGFTDTVHATRPAGFYQVRVAMD
jgi:hypothetical protein